MKSSADSPKTPGGISKSLLTPCRRVGLSRNWGKKGVSPFISPLTGGNSSSDVKEEKLSRKRKICTSDDEESSKNENDLTSTPEFNNKHLPASINSTPVRNIPLSKKKSKTLVMKEKKERHGSVDNNINTLKIEISEDGKLDNIEVDTELTEPVSIPKTTSKKLKKEIKQCNLMIENKTIEKQEHNSSLSGNIDQDVREKSPNNLTKECIVVIQNKMIKNLGLEKKLNEDKSIQPPKCASQTIFDSDDETPLCDLNKKEDSMNNKNKENFTSTKVNKLKDKNTSTTGLKENKLKNIPRNNKKPILQIKNSQNSSDDDDFESFNKRTILIKKSYDKIVKPIKAKSTGSITQKDIDDLKARIEMKKKQLLVKAISEDTAELRNLIKKWQKGCQEALFELFDLMRKKFPDRQNMDYSEILQTLKIPPDLVGYDVENDCFVTPDDASVILSSINT